MTVHFYSPPHMDRRGPPLPRYPSYYGRGHPQHGSLWKLLVGLAALLLLAVAIGALVRATVCSRDTAVSSSTSSFARPTAPMQHAPVPEATTPPGGRTLPTPTPSLSRTAGQRLSTATPTVAVPDIASLQRLMLEAINRDRRQQGLKAVAWDETAARVGDMHAREMAENSYLSHWNLAGYGPDHRYAQAGGRDAVQENVYTFKRTWSDGSPALITDWDEAIGEAERSLMSSAGHRANILAPEHTHVGVGIAYNTRTGEVYITQEFVNRYVILDDMPTTVPRGTTVTVSGKLLAGATNPLINLAYEPFPKPLTVQELRKTGTYQSKAAIVEAVMSNTDGSGRFSGMFRLGGTGAGYYHVRVWTSVGSQNCLASNVIISVR